MGDDILLDIPWAIAYLTFLAELYSFQLFAMRSRGGWVVCARRLAW